MTETEINQHMIENEVELVADKTTSCIIAKALNKNNKPLLKYKYKERYNLLKVKYLCSLSENEFIGRFWEEDELDQCGEEWDMDKYIKNVRKELENILLIARKRRINEDFITIEREYKRSKKGRHFVQEIGLQSFQNKIRRFLSGDTSYDIDMSKCHWNILVRLCDIHDIHCNRIKKFLKNPNQIMEEQGVDKYDLLKMMYLDNFKSDNEFLVKLHKTKQFVFEEIMETEHFKSMKFKPSDKSKKNKNSMSSVMSQYLQHLESEILISVLNKYPDDIEVLMFDGFQPSKTVNVKKMLAELKELTGFEWTQKDNTFDIAGWEEEELSDYMTWAKEFEKNVFAINEPKRCYAVNYDRCKFLLSPHELLDRFPEHLDMVKNWVADEGKRVYDKFVYQPYNAMSEDPTPDNVYNTWIPYTRKVLDEHISEEEVSWFSRLCEMSLVNYKNLDEPDDECRKGGDWIKNWCAYMIQNPDKRIDVYPVILGKQGSGKDTLVKIMSMLLGSERVVTTSNITDYIGGQFNSHIDGVQLILLNESTVMDVKEVEGHIKNHVTSDEIVLKTKCQPTRTIANYCNILFATNNKYPFDTLDRRTQGFETKNWRGKYKKDSSEFFDSIYASINDETAMTKLWTYFNQRDVSNWIPRKSLYETEVSKAGKDYSRPSYIRYCDYLLDNKFQFTNDCDEIVWDSRTDFKNDYRKWSHEEYGQSDDKPHILKANLITTKAFVWDTHNNKRIVRCDMEKLKNYIEVNYPRDEFVL